ncbi:solute carrier family 12 member 4-like, partial [Myiozetetes cayanensis]|uniref:solute carrier family 12 member 4-like n=1 Tax=Myiozetetes cayanensis TaxID=478635 RepID=UPI00215F22F5
MLMRCCASPGPGPLRPCAPPHPPTHPGVLPPSRGRCPPCPPPARGSWHGTCGPAPQGGLGEEQEGEGDASFGVLLGLSLPSASGVLWGCSRCAELRDVARSVPAGTLGAATATALGYLSAALLLGAGVEGQLLRDKFGVSLGGSPVLGAAAWPWPWVPVLGALLSAGGAGLQALLGGSRLLRGLARTQALPLPHALARGRLWPLVATAATATLGVLVGSLDLLAPVLSV